MALIYLNKYQQSKYFGRGYALGLLFFLVSLHHTRSRLTSFSTSATFLTRNFIAILVSRFAFAAAAFSATSSLLWSSRNQGFGTVGFIGSMDLTS